MVARARTSRARTPRVATDRNPAAGRGRSAQEPAASGRADLDPAALMARARALTARGRAAQAGAAVISNTSPSLVLMPSMWSG